MEEDDRFKHIASDPKFKVLKRKERKVEIDERFRSMFTDKKFTSSADNLKKFYDIKEDKEQDKVEEDDHDEDDDKDEEEDQSEQESLSESSDESDESDGYEADIKADQFDWQPLDHDAEKADIATNRLAIQNLDWDKINANDLFTLIKSVRMPLNVRIYVSEFGKERLAREEVEGPQELIDMPKEDEDEEEYRDLQEKMRAIKNVGPKTYKINEYEDADEQVDLKNEELRERVRRYQLNKMKYYYAIAEFDSAESAELVYKELDGLEYEGSSIELDLRFVPDDVEFDAADMKAECDHVPDISSYKAPSFISSALQQTTVNLTWDQTDIKRQEKLHRAFTKEEMDKDDLEAYLGSGSDSDGGDEIDKQMDFPTDNKYKQLLQSLDADNEKRKKVDVDVEWGNESSGNESDEGDENSDDDEFDDDDSNLEDSDDDGSHSDDDQSDSSSSHESDRVKTIPNKKKQQKKKQFSKRDAKLNEEAHQDSDLNLLMIEPKSNDQPFDYDINDERFKAVYEEAAYNIDPSHPNFKRTKFFDEIAEKKRKKRQKIS